MEEAASLANMTVVFVSLNPDSHLSMSSQNSQRFPELRAAGTPTEIGHSIGEHFRTEILELTEVVIERFNKGSEHPVNWDHVAPASKVMVSRVAKYFPEYMEEVEATARASGTTVEKLMVLNARNMLGSVRSEGCTSIMVGSKASQTGNGLVGQNWDNDPAMRPFSAVITREPTNGSRSMSWTQPGLISYIGMNDKGLGICLNALNGPNNTEGVPWYFFVRSILDSDSIEKAVSSLDSAPRSISASAAMISREGPVNLEITPDVVHPIWSSNEERQIHTNHCVHPGLITNNEEYSENIYGQSFDRKSRAEALIIDSSPNREISVKEVTTALSDHAGYPTSICRHPNDHSITGWQRSVISILMEPDAGIMLIAPGNPCENEYETYLLN